MKKWSQHINFTNHKVHSFFQTGQTIVDLGNNKGGSNNESSSKLTDIQNSLLMRIVDTPEKDVSHSEANIITRKLRTYSDNASSILF